jgi:tetratricopeptide (TPR) repeat protein
MPSPPSALLRKRARGAALAATVVLTVAGCGGGQPRYAPAVPRSDLPFLIAPDAGFTLTGDPAIERTVREAHRALIDRAASQEARSAASAALARDPAYLPARVLEAQAWLVDRGYRQAVDLLLPAVAEYPDFTAAQLVLGRAAEALGELPEALDAYLAASPASGAAAERARVIRDRAVEIVAYRVDDAVRRGRLDEAGVELARLRRWEPEGTPTLQASLQLATARGDAESALTAVRTLTARLPDDRGLLERQAELEMTAGDPGVSLDLWQQLVQRYPRDGSLKDQLERAKFRWRLKVLPEGVQALVDHPVLTRADFARLLYWLVPGVRSAAAPTARIATDILDRPHRQELVRVINLHLMDVDESLHEFAPDRALTREEALLALLRALRHSGTALSCLAGGIPPFPSYSFVCSTAARCGVLGGEGQCLPEATVSGDEALEWIRRTLRY